VMLNVSSSSSKEGLIVSTLEVRRPLRRRNVKSLLNISSCITFKQRCVLISLMRK